MNALLLDLGNVLAFHDNELLFRELATLFGSSSEAFRARLDGGLWQRVNTGQLPGDALRAELCARLGVEVSADDFERAWCCHFTLNEPMIRAVERLVGQTRLVLLSNTHDLHVRHLRPLLPVLQRFDALVFSCEVGVMKPDPRIFEAALKVAGVRPEQAVFFDDLPRFVDAAQALGITARLFTDAERFEAQLAELGGLQRPP